MIESDRLISESQGANTRHVTNIHNSKTTTTTTTK